MAKVKSLLSHLILLWLKIFARLQLLKTNPTIIGITGSAGKTSAVYATEAVLKQTPNLRVTRHANSESGIPLHILGLKMTNFSPLDWLRVVFMAPLQVLTNWQPVDTYIMEMGIDSPNPPKNMGHLLSIVQPTIGVFLNAQVAHSQNFDHLVQATGEDERVSQIKSLIAAEKGKLIESLPPTGHAILNLDDELVAQFISKTKAQVITFGFNPNAAISIVDITPNLQGTWVKIKYNEQLKEFIIPNTALIKSYGYAFGAAIAVGLSRGLTIDQSIENLKTHFRLPPGRMSLISAVNQAIIIDSSYNASEKPVIEALEVLGRIATGKKYALLGDMNELGQESQSSHQKVAEVAGQICDHVYLIGSQMTKYADPILGEKSTILTDAKHAVQVIQSKLQPNDVILIKGSQNGLFLEYAVEKLMKNPQNASQLLCRRGAFWQQQRAKIGLI